MLQWLNFFFGIETFGYLDLQQTVFYHLLTYYFQQQQLQLDYRALLDEKEELSADRDYYKGKVQRLNHQLSYIVTSRASKGEGEDPPKPIVDIDGLVTENKYLHERITQLQVEKEIIKRTLSKYKVTNQLVCFWSSWPNKVTNYAC